MQFGDLNFWTTTYTLTPPPIDQMRQHTAADPIIKLTVIEPVGEPQESMISGMDVVENMALSVIEGFFDPSTANEFLTELASGHEVSFVVSTPI